MSDTLKNFLVDLASDPERMNRYLTDPAREIDSAGLSATDKAALLTRDSGALRRTLGASPAHHMTRVVTMDPTLPGEDDFEAGGPVKSAKSAKQKPVKKAAQKKKKKTAKSAKKKSPTKKSVKKKAAPARKRKAGAKK